MMPMALPTSSWGNMRKQTAELGLRKYQECLNDYFHISNDGNALLRPGSCYTAEAVPEDEAEGSEC